MGKYTVYEEECYQDWFNTQSFKSKNQIRARLLNIEDNEHFEHIRDLNEDGDGLKELKFNDGRRIYYVIIPVDNIILLLGGNKNGQDKDIKKARNIIKKAQDNAKKRTKA